MSSAACAGHSFRALVTRCAFVGLFLTCALFVRSACALYTSSALATRCVCVVNALASLQILTNVGRTTTHWSYFPFVLTFQCADRASRMCDWAFTRLQVMISSKLSALFRFNCCRGQCDRPANGRRCVWAGHSTFVVRRLNERFSSRTNKNRIVCA